jgi:hypothetical protein
MLTTRIRSRWIPLFVVVLAAGLSAGGVVASQLRADAVVEELEASTAGDQLMRIADIAAADGHAGRGVFAQSTSTGFFCLWDAPSAGALNRQGGCNSIDDPLGGRQMFISFAYEGGPAAADVKDARLIGLAADDVSSVAVVMDDGTRRAMKLRKAMIESRAYSAFGHRFSRGELRRGVTPVAVVAFDQNGNEIDRQETGFGG